MARILFAWELGGDYGHLSRLLPVARELSARGHEPVFAVRDLLGAEAILAPHALSWYQAPLWIGQLTNLPPPIGYPELLMRFGFLNGRALTGVCRAWRNLVGLLAPQLLVLDHAPTALLATRGLGIPRLHFGDGFCIPPATRPLPPFRWWAPENSARLIDSEQHAWKAANEVLLALGAPPLVCLSELLACDATLFCTFAELDHYPQRATPEFAGPIFSLGQGAPAEWPAAGDAKVFAYLKPGYVHLDKILQALHGSSASVLVHVPGAARRTLAAYTAAHMAFSEEPVDMEQARAACDLAVCHGGAGTVAAMLLAGKPLLVLPMQMEQTMAARRIEAMGAGACVTADMIAQLPRALRRALRDEAAAQAARGFAQRHAGYDQGATVRLAADRCESLLEARG